jgi:ATP-dependent RNA helicase DDX46/PRP5
LKPKSRRDDSRDRASSRRSRSRTREVSCPRFGSC